jgi:hypothetical protein
MHAAFNEGIGFSRPVNLAFIEKAERDSRWTDRYRV